jgi:hypothetical protein
MGTDGDFAVVVIPLLVEKGWRALPDGVFKILFSTLLLSFCFLIAKRGVRGIGLTPDTLRANDRHACHSAWSKAQAQNPSIPFTFLLLPLSLLVILRECAESLNAVYHFVVVVVVNSPFTVRTKSDGVELASQVLGYLKCSFPFCCCCGR